MQYDRNEIEKFLEKIEEVTKIDLTHANCETVQERLDDLYAKAQKEKKHLPLFNKYLYRKLKLPCERKNEKIKASTTTLNAISQALGYESFSHFIRATGSENAPALRNCLGEWSSYVRCNSGQPYVLRSPVRIYEERKEVYMELKGPVRTFIGQVRLRGDCLHCLLESDQVKKIYLVLKAGFSTNPKVLQGIFSGVSTAGDPIAGREVLIREQYLDKRRGPDRISLSILRNSLEEEENYIADYFAEKQHTILKSGVSSTFGIDDLKGN